MPITEIMSFNVLYSLFDKIFMFLYVFVMSILVHARYMLIYYFRLGASCMFTSLYVVPEFLWYTVISGYICFLDMLYIQLVFLPLWICGMYEDKIKYK